MFETLCWEQNNMSLEETRNEFNVRIQEGEAFVAFIERLQTYDRIWVDMGKIIIEKFMARFPIRRHGNQEAAGLENAKRLFHIGTGVGNMFNE